MTLKTKVNRQLAKLPTYHDEIPLLQIFNIARAHGFEPVQEDGTPWSGFLCGASGHAVFQLESLKNVLVLDWYTMQSGRYEINVYVS